MHTISPHLLATLSLTGGLAFSMVWLGARMRLLDRPVERRCPSCGLTVRRGAHCSCAG